MIRLPNVPLTIVRMLTNAVNSTLQWRNALIVASQLLFVTPTIAADVVARITKEKVFVAEPFTLEITVLAPLGERVTFSPVLDRLGLFDVLDVRDALDVPHEAGRSWTRKLILESIATGDLVVPPVGVQIEASGLTSQVFTEPITVRVESVIQDASDPTKFRDIISVVDAVPPTPESHTWIWWMVGAFAGGSTLAIVGFVFFRRGSKPSPRDWAMEQLGELESAIVSKAAANQILAQNICEVVHNFLVFEFSINESGKTSQELVDGLSQSGQIDAAEAGRLNGLFEQADRVKFAGMSISDESLKKILKDSREMILRIGDESHREVG